jgi:hypothetical protein
MAGINSRDVNSKPRQDGDELTDDDLDAAAGSVRFRLIRVPRWRPKAAAPETGYRCQGSGSGTMVTLSEIDTEQSVF